MILEFRGSDLVEMIEDFPWSSLGDLSETLSGLEYLRIRFGPHLFGGILAEQPASLEIPLESDDGTS